MTDKSDAQSPCAKEPKSIITGARQANAGMSSGRSSQQDHHKAIRNYIGVEDNELEIEINKYQDKFKDQSSMGENYSKFFWNERSVDARTWGIFISSQQFIWQINDFFNPLDVKHFYINLGYITNSLICFCSFAYSFRNSSIKYHLIPILFITTQQEVRICDFENTRR